MNLLKIGRVPTAVSMLCDLLSVKQGRPFSRCTWRAYVSTRAKVASSLSKLIGWSSKRAGNNDTRLAAIGAESEMRARGAVLCGVVVERWLKGNHSRNSMLTNMQIIYSNYSYRNALVAKSIGLQRN